MEISAGRMLLVLALVLAATVLGLLLRAREGRRRAVPGGGPTLADVVGAAGVLGDGSVPTGVTVVQVSSAVCSPCRATARTWRRVAGPDRHLEVDIEQRPEVAQLLSVWRTPTSFVFDRHGVLVTRVDGAPDLDQATSALREAGAVA